ncbi:hypothetical protein C0995_005692 [Termitomyces sp. Mi166|nr:hypothetical protein C0995_005692 [Termitomyces sp. Mi166\
MAKWMEKKKAENLESSDKDLVDAIIHQQATYTEEAQLMELLANDKADEDRILDDEYNTALPALRSAVLMRKSLSLITMESQNYLLKHGSLKGEEFNDSSHTGGKQGWPMPQCIGSGLENSQVIEKGQKKEEKGDLLEGETDDETEEQPKKKLLTKVEALMKQTQPQSFSWAQCPFHFQARKYSA